MVRATYPIGREDQAHTRIRFEWLGDEPAVSPQVAILLQVLVDSVTTALERCDSRLVPYRDAARPQDSAAPAQVPLASSGGSVL
jgi:hypothetical protein